ncbi:MAG: ZIP family metal transporter [Bacillota bacterium]
MVAVTLISLAALAADLLGGWFTLRCAQLKEEMDRLMAVGAGFLLGSALLSMLPAAVGQKGGALTVALGFAVFLLLRSLAAPSGARRRPLGVESAWAVFTGMLLHSLVEGAALGLAAQAGGQFGWIGLLAMMLHKLPEGFSLATVILSASDSPRLAILGVLAIGLATVVGGWTALLWAKLALLSHGAVLGVAAGSFLYVGATEMLPHVLRRGGSTWLVLVGMLLVYLLT